MSESVLDGRAVGSGPGGQRRKTTGQAPRSLRARLDLALWDWMLRKSPRHESLGMPLYALTLPAGMEKVFFGKVRRALELIRRYQPRRLEALKRNVAAIGGVAGGWNYYRQSTRTIVLTWPGVLRSSAAEMAMTIIHEATHARIAQFGVPYDEPARARIETICVGQEVAFARALPGGEELAQQQLKRLETPWWTAEELRRWRIMAARAHDIPEWLIRWMDRLNQRRLSSSHG